MSESGHSADSEATRRFVENMRKAAEAESVEARAREWRGRSVEERGRIALDLLDFAEAVRQSRGSFPDRPLPRNLSEIVAQARNRDRDQ